MHNYKELKIWQKAIDLTEQIYGLTAGFPQEERYGLSSQIQRASISISSNIAEGSSRESIKEFNHFLSISLGSSFEMETQLIVAKKIGYLNQIQLENITDQITELIKMIRGFKKSLFSTDLKSLV